MSRIQEVFPGPKRVSSAQQLHQRTEQDSLAPVSRATRASARLEGRQTSTGTCATSTVECAISAAPSASTSLQNEAISQVTCLQFTVGSTH